MLGIKNKSFHMKYVKTFEQFTDKSDEIINEGKNDKGGKYDAMLKHLDKQEKKRLQDKEAVKKAKDNFNAGSASNVFRQVATKLQKEVDKEKEARNPDKDFIKLQGSDAKAYFTIADLIKTDFNKAKSKFRRLDTATKDYLVDYGSKSAAKNILMVFGYEMNESEDRTELIDLLEEGITQQEQPYVDAEMEFDVLFHKIQQAKFGWNTKTRFAIDKIADQLLNLKKKYTSIKLEE